MQANLKDQFDQQYTSPTETFKAEDGTSPQWKKSILIACDALDKTKISDTHYNNTKGRIANIIKAYIKDKSAKECSQRFATYLSNGIKVGTQQITFNKKDVKGNTAIVLFAHFLNEINNIAQAEYKKQESIQIKKRLEDNAIKELLKVIKNEKNPEGLKKIEEEILQEKSEYFYTDDNGQKVTFDVTDEQKEQIKKAIENSKSKQSQQDSAQAVSAMGARKKDSKLSKSGNTRAKGKSRQRHECQKVEVQAEELAKKLYRAFFVLFSEEGTAKIFRHC